MDVRDSLLLVDLDKGGEQLGPLFEEPRRRLQDDAKFRAAWTQYQGLRALAWEAAPELDERLVRQGLQASRRQEVERRLARATGSQDAARELLLKPGAGKRSGLPVWAAFLLLVGALGLGWLAFGPSSPAPAPANSFPVSTPVAANADSAMAFEFPVQTPPRDAALDLGTPPASDETRAENADAREARRLVRENLQAAAQGPAPTIVPTPRPKPTHKAVAHAAPTKPVPKATATSVATATPAPSTPTKAVGAASVVAVAVASAPTPAATLAPTAAPTEGPAIISFTPEPSPRPTAAAAPSKASNPRLMDGAVTEASLFVSAAQFPAYAVLNLPSSGPVDLRLFDMRGRLVQRYGEGELGAGRWRYDLPAVDEHGQTLPKGSYYLRVITHWFSKVEALEQP